LRNLLQRTLSGIIYLVIIIGGLFLGKYSFGALFLVIGILALHEFYNLLNIPLRSPVSIVGLAGGGVIFILGFLTASDLLPLRFMAFIALVAIAVFIVALYAKNIEIGVIGNVLLGIIYVILPITAMNFLAFYDGHQYSYRIILGVLILIWINDTGAYVTGSLLGRHKLFPRISPKKSWEGLAGGTLFTMGAAFGMKYLMATSLQTENWISIGVITCILAVYGDLTESLFKRNADKKDSGSIMPGHGGILDRFDSILFVMPAVLVYLLIK
jgi:phosphatidate cytidylyltransferase